MEDINIEEIIKLHGKRVYNLAYRVTCNREDAEDITQETFFNVYKNIKKFQGRSNVFTWIYKIALNITLRYKSKIDKKLFDKLDEKILYYKDKIPDEVKNWETNPEKAYLINELVNEIKQECTYFMTFKLTEEQRFVYILKFVLDFSYKEISEILEIQESTVKARLHRARTNLIKHFKNHCNWLNPKNNCNCKIRIGFILSFAPEILDRVKKYATKSEDRLITKNIKKIPGIKSYINNLPLFDYKIKDYEYYINIE